MFLKNLKYAFRNLKRDKFYTFLNGVGLTIGMAVTLLLLMWIQDELSYDNYHQKNGLNYLVLGNTEYAGESRRGVKTPYNLALATKEHIPEVEHIARSFHLWKPTIEFQNNFYASKNTHLIDPELFEILDFDFIKGDAKTALLNPKSIVLTEDMANRIFGNSDPLGKTININDKLQLNVTGVIKNPPINTHLQVDCFVPFEENKLYFTSENNLRWSTYNLVTYLTLKPNSDFRNIEKKLSALFPKEANNTDARKRHFELHPVQDIYLGLEKIKFGFVQGDWNYIRLFGIIGFIILLIASINYVNLTTARAAHRAKTTGIKKIIGATKAQIFNQHILEAITLVVVCSLGALLLAQLCLPQFEVVSGKEFSNGSVFSVQTILTLCGVSFVTILLSSIQPALQLASFKPVEVLKGNSFKGVAGKGGLRQILVVTQFVGSAALITCTIFMLRQMDFIQSSKLGYEKEHIFSFKNELENPQLLTETLKNQPGINDVAISDQSIVSITNSSSIPKWEGSAKDENVPVFYVYAGSNFKDFFNLEMQSGRWFRPGQLDSTSFIINEATAKAMQLDDPVGKWIEFWGTRGTIAGVVKDFHFQSFHNEIQQLIFVQSANYFPTTYVKTTGSDASKAIASAEKIFKQHSPNAVFTHEFLDESYNKLYTNESRVGSLFFLFALIAIIISCVGIFGLATYTAERRFKEIGIRKVLGASVLSIVQLLSKDFLKPVILAIVLAIPIAWYFMNNWLSEFAYRIELDWLGFFLAAILAIVIALLTVGFQSVRAAVSNPAESIKSE